MKILKPEVPRFCRVDYSILIRDFPKKIAPSIFFYFKLFFFSILMALALGVFFFLHKMLEIINK